MGEVPFFAENAEGELVAGDAMEDPNSSDPSILSAAGAALRERLERLESDPLRHVTQRTDDEVFDLMASYLSGAKVNAIRTEANFTNALSLILSGAITRRRAMASHARRVSPDASSGTVLLSRMVCLEILNHWTWLEECLGPKGRDLFMDHTRRMIDWGDEPPEFSA